ncbi:unnamed protein product [Notodromas monacha]|uniref:Uncharacterized protein n=1 Tax=Notodromas monacha TaxID=399045 RepID=A0A7R9GCE7_9CRUS|nr:unnamed protein product [Notodromas monacha]CAG0915898.1 unnamed protein product [Notodromas monacha]
MRWPGWTGLDCASRVDALAQTTTRLRRSFGVMNSLYIEIHGNTRKFVVEKPCGKGSYMNPGSMSAQMNQYSVVVSFNFRRFFRLEILSELTEKFVPRGPWLHGTSTVK